MTALDALLTEAARGTLNKKRDIRALIKAGALPWPIDKDKKTPLHLAVEHGWFPTIKCLIDFFILQPIFKKDVLLESVFRDALINMQDAAQDTALHIAVRGVLNGDSVKYLLIVKLLLQSGANVDKKNNAGQSAADIALSSDTAKKIPYFMIYLKK